MVEEKKKSGFRRSSFSWYDPTDWGHTPSADFKFTIKVLPIVLLMIIAFSFGISNSGTYASAGRSMINHLGGNSKSQLREAYAYIVAKNYDGAAVLAGEVARDDPDNPLAYLILGLAHAHRGLTEEASASLHRAVELDPGFAMAWYNLGVVEESRGELTLALEAYNHAHEIEPDNVSYSDGLDRMKETILNGTNWDFQETEIERVFLSAVNAANRGGEQDLAFAEDIFRNLVAERPYDVASKNMLGFTLARQGRHAEAEEVLLEVVDAEPGYSDAWYNLGMIRESLGRLEEARHDFETAYNSSSVSSFREIAQREMNRITAILETETNVTP